ncbi:MAG: cytochrome C assembly family protein [Alphaproteobacteria bacterium]
MPVLLIFGISALASLIPAWLYVVRGGGRTPVYWLLLAVALAGPGAWATVQLTGHWQTGFSTALWLTVAASVLVFACLAVATRSAWRLTPLLVPYLAVLGGLAMIWQASPGQPLSGEAPQSWLAAHIIVSVLTYALITIGAVAGLAVLLQERALKARRPTGFTHRLPAIAEAERLEIRLLLAGEVVLGAGLLTGIATLYAGSGAVIVPDHKTIFAIVAFVVIALLLLLRHFLGIRGRRAARLALAGYLFITLAYPGVKFVTDVLIAG